jgi:hypothetical protein
MIASSPTQSLEARPREAESDRPDCGGRTLTIARSQWRGKLRATVLLLGKITRSSAPLQSQAL